MDFKEALGKLKQLEGGNELAEIFEKEVEILKEKNFAVIGEIREARNKLRGYEPAIAMLAELGIESVTEEAIKNFTQSHKNAIASLSNAQSQVADLQGKLSAKEREILIRDAATKAGANAIALTRLLDPNVPIEVSPDGKVMVGEEGKKLELVKYVDVNLVEFKPAIFPNRPQNLPDAPPSVKEERKPSTAKSVSNYYAPVPSEYKQGK